MIFLCSVGNNANPFSTAPTYRRVRLFWNFIKVNQFQSTFLLDRISNLIGD